MYCLEPFGHESEKLLLNVLRMQYGKVNICSILFGLWSSKTTCPCQQYCESPLIFFVLLHLKKSIRETAQLACLMFMIVLAMKEPLDWTTMFLMKLYLSPKLVQMFY
ncbi:uncharacterized protein LOC120016418 isoform X1 [Tripterygium wilfordii]|uniref:uncharacterized protein LOC120016418 isoform X1 n=1 Tax=Tripterygium wilfordii TaxID=458696 RepID=UPI0018F7E615|nr:uncharacterized protein LOC120016418 isoform X1 [Tripterygium wilfordii]XP_038725112.1 uncharacterized protein LOC120016418 isoform X1 [Tripterygium wilfordii]